MDNINNGRINVNTPDIKDQFDMYDKIPTKATTFHDAMRGNSYDTELSDLFFSKENQEILQNGIRVGVYNKSGNKYVIGIQDYDNLQTIMRSMFLQYSLNQKDNITEQIRVLNNIVLNYCIPKVFEETVGYLKYKNDISTIAQPLDLPKISREDHKQLEFKSWM